MNHLQMCRNNAHNRETGTGASFPAGVSRDQEVEVQINDHKL